MKLAILGASGGCGTELVAQALRRNHSLVLIARDSSKLPSAGSVEVIRGRLDDSAMLAKAFSGCDAVVSALGLRAKGFSPFSAVEELDFLRRSSPAVVEAMKRAKVRRLIAISAGGVGDSYAWMPGVFKAVIKASVLRKVYPELDAMERTFVASGLDVCLVRPTGLTDGPTTGRARVVTKLNGRATISRADVAAFMLDALGTEPFADRCPVITVEG